MPLTVSNVISLTHVVVASVVGFGGLALTLYGQRFVRRKRSTEQGRGEPPPPSVPPGYSAKEIMNVIQAAPPLRREQIAEKYRGLHVTWILPVSSCKRETWPGAGPMTDPVDLMLRVDGPMALYAWCCVDVAKYPAILDVRCNGEVTVSGVIEAAGEYSIRLQGARILDVSNAST